MKKRTKKIAITGITVLMCTCFLCIAILHNSIEKSIWGAMGIDSVNDIDKVQLAQQDFRAEELLSKSDRISLFYILSTTRKYDKTKDKTYVLNGSFLSYPIVHFEVDGEKQEIYWEYETGIIHYGGIEEKSVKYYLEEENAAELKELYEKYIDLRGVSRQ